MNKQDPNDVVDRFISDVAAALDRTSRLLLAPLTDQDENAVAENLLFSAVVAWETFRSDWHLAAINKDPSSFRGQLAQKIEAAIKVNLSERVSAIVMASLNLPNHYNVADVRAILDAEGRNVTFTGGKKEVTAHLDNLSPTWKLAASKMTKDERDTVALATKCRNAIAHRSDMSMQAFNSAMQDMKSSKGSVYKALARENAVRRNNIGTYLKALAVPAKSGKVSRVYFICDVMGQAAQRFVV